MNSFKYKILCIYIYIIWVFLMHFYEILYLKFHYRNSLKILINSMIYFIASNIKMFLMEDLQTSRSSIKNHLIDIQRSSIHLKATQTSISWEYLNILIAIKYKKILNFYKLITELKVSSYDSSFCWQWPYLAFTIPFHSKNLFTVQYLFSSFDISSQTCLLKWFVTTLLKVKW